jgi:hypothetical protein
MLDRLREQGEEFLRARAALVYRGRTTPSSAPGLRDLYTRFAQVFSPDAITEVQRLLAGATGEAEQAGRYLLEFLVDGTAARAAAPELEHRAGWLRAGTVPFGDERVPAAQLDERLGETTSSSVRWALEDARLAAIEDLEPALARIVQAEQDVVIELGYGDYVRARGVLAGIDIVTTAREAAGFLEDTDGLYRDLLSWHLPRLAGVAPGEARWVDAAPLFRAAPFDRYFASEPILPAMQTMLREMELDAFAAGRVSLETAPAAEGPASCHALDVPGDVRLVAREVRSRPGWEALLRQLGAALAFGYSAADLPMEFRWLGDPSLPLAYGLTFGSLLAAPAWLKRIVGVRRDHQPELLRLHTLLELLSLRAEAARLQYQLEAHDSAGLRMEPQRYAEIMSAATGLRHDPREHLWELEVGLFAARRLRAAQLGAILSGYMRDRFDEDWFCNPRAGSALAGLFSSGRRYTAAEHATQLASSALNFQPVLTRIQERTG